MSCHWVVLLINGIGEKMKQFTFIHLKVRSADIFADDTVHCAPHAHMPALRAHHVPVVCTHGVRDTSKHEAGDGQTQSICCFHNDQ